MSSKSISESATMPSLAAAIKTIRDVLRKHGITDMDSMQHCMLLAGVRMLEPETCQKLKFPLTHSWPNLLKFMEAKNDVKAMELFRSMLKALDAKFETNDFHWNLENRDDTLKVLRCMANVNMTEASKNTDVLGYIYEQHVATGAGKGGGRDLGKFYTDRAITRYLSHLLGVKVVAGRPESMCDATMGTGGFILSHIQTVQEQHPDAVWEDDSIAGGDIDDKVAAICKLNLFMKTGKVFPMIGRRNTLKDDIGPVSSRRRFKIVLMNIPFGVKNLVLAHDCCERVREIVKAGTKSEPLFMALVCQLVDDEGRAAVIVPDGVLVNQSVQHVAMRKYLLDHFELKRVIKMKGQFFMNTGIQPSILFFENTGKPTSVVEFWDVIKGANGDIEETMVLSVPRAKFDASCSFDMRRYQEVKAVANPAGFPMVKLGDLYEVPKVIKKFNSGDMNNRGDSAFFNGKWDCPVGNHSEHSFASDKEYFVLIKDGGGDHSSSTVGMGKFFKVMGKCSITSHNVVLIQKKENDITHHYVYYYMMLNIKSLRDKARYSINLGSISMGDIMDFPISLPSLETQQEIVATLDRIYAPGTTELAETLKLTDKAMELVLANPGGASLEPIVEAQRLIRKSAQMVADVNVQMVADVKVQMVALCRALDATSPERKKLGEILTDHPPKSPVTASKAETTGSVPLYSSSTEVARHSTAEFSGKPFLLQGSRGTISKATHYCEQPFAVSNNVFVLSATDPATTNLKFIYYYLRLTGLADSVANTSVIPMLTKAVFREMEVPVPPFEVQQTVLARLDALQSQIGALEALQRAAEDNGRFILDSHLGC